MVPRTFKYFLGNIDSKKHNILTALKNLIEKRVAKGGALHLTFMDLHKSSDTVSSNKLRTSMENDAVKILLKKDERNDLQDSKVLTPSIKKALKHKYGSM